MTLDRQTSISRDTEQRIAEFAREQSRYYLDRAQMTYWERLQDKAERTRGKAERKLARLKLRSSQAEQSEADLAAYMGDFVSDLVSSGLNEQEAFGKAAAELAADSGSAEADGLSDLYRLRYLEHWADGDALGVDGRLAADSGHGLYYSGCPTIGLVIGAVLGLFVDPAFFSGLVWLSVAAGGLAGSVAGVGCAMLLHARALRLERLRR